MQSCLNTATQKLLEPAQLNIQQMQQLLQNLCGKQIDWADLYFQYICGESWYLEDSIVKQGSFYIDQGYGLRAVSGEKTGFAYADEISLQSIQRAANHTKSIVQSGTTKTINLSRGKSHPFLSLYPEINPLHSLTDDEKVKLLHEIDQLTRKQDPRVKQVIVQLSASHEIVLVISSDGVVAADVRPLVYLSLQVIVQQNGRTEQGSAGGGSRNDYRYFNLQRWQDEYVKQAIRQALVRLEAKSAPAGMMPVILGSGWPAVLLHEAIGHGLEADFNRKGSSNYSNQIGEKVASSICTVVDDGTIANHCGSLNIDDEGTPTERTVLIENGVLRNYMQDRHNAWLMQSSLTGNGRRESYAHLPFPRMTNTCLLPGNIDPDEIIASVTKGIYAVDFMGGQVDITSGNFVFSMKEAYMIENGKITYPITGATLIGNGPEILNRVTMVGNDFQLDPGQGMCSKAGQTVPVGVGQPTVKVEQMTVGGVSDL